ncbi:hypothetical protein Trichorick_00737 [Candidatus Trichorickettsia mobilis]|uniref:Fido domain-containing protein n=1 Tax=Candidatus Trichorickettsia mobilis TaxID=1346319 RepID=A0ABZ0UV36_9RICK|nr:hypothetical protein [Candidatus Trichorickettsia mobilis]WPY00848.1 hypothetical protein Trichorick_00737 [Candidatus Trichorickettsia mobilis]
MKSKKEEYIEQLQQILTQDNFWRLFVDGKKQQKQPQQQNGLNEAKFGHLDWAMREMHGLKRMQDTAKWLFSKEYIDEPLSYKLLTKIHESAFPFEDHLLFSWKSTIVGTKRTFGVPASAEQYLTVRAQEIQIQVDADKAPWKYVPQSATRGIIETIWTPEERQKYIEILSAKYNSIKTELAQDQKALLLHIVTMAQTVEDIHNASDGNCRSIITLWLNKELVSHGFKPIILEDPNDFEHYEPQQLLYLLDKGQEAFFKFFTTGYPYNNCYIDAEIRNNICQLKSIDLLYYTHHDKKIVTPNIINHQLTNYIYHGSGKDEIQQIISKQGVVNTYDKFAPFLDQYISMLILTKYKGQENYYLLHEKISAKYFKYYCEAKNIDINETNNLFEQWLNFVEVVKLKINSIFYNYQISLLDPATCHLLDSELNIDQLKTIIKCFPKEKCSIYKTAEELYKNIQQTVYTAYNDSNKCVKMIADLANGVPCSKEEFSIIQTHAAAYLNTVDKSIYGMFFKHYSHLLDVISYTQPELLGDFTEIV